MTNHKKKAKKWLKKATKDVFTYEEAQAYTLVALTHAVLALVDELEEPEGDVEPLIIVDLNDNSGG